MRFAILSLFVPVALASVTFLEERQTLAGSQVCQQISSFIKGEVYYPLDLTGNFSSGISHWMSSSQQTPMCVVYVANAQEVTIVMKIVGSTRTPFAVKSGGHASNQGFSSTTGIQISLANINQVVLSADKTTCEIGLGNVWTDVYTALQGTGYNVVGGRVSGPGTGGFSLGGGFSWLTQQYGLTADTAVSYNLVLPNGTAIVVDKTKPDLFFALKGGLNRFGIVTSMILKTKPQTDVYGGLKVFGADKIDALIAATEEFQNTNTDPKAQVILTINGGTVPGAILLSFYDGPSQPTAFNVYNYITGALISTVKSQTFASFSTGTPSQIEAGNRGAFATLSTTTLSTSFMKAVKNESSFYGTLALLHSGILLSYDIEPFLNYGKHATDSAYPHSNSPLPLNLYFAWTDAGQDAFWHGIMQQSINHLTDIAKAEGIFVGGAYPNYALSTYTGQQLYGATNTARLRKIQAKYDPTGIMQLTGGFSF